MVQPYQIFFPIGLLHGLWGVLVWSLFLFGWIGYPGASHAHLMIVGFLFSFSLGFLMTAVPRFTGAQAAKPWEMGLGAVLALGSFFGMYSSALALAVLIFLAVFFLSRFKQRIYSPPKHFVFIPIGLILGITGSIMMMVDFWPGRVYLFQGTMLCLVLGVGGKLVSALLGWSSSPLVQLTVAGAQKKAFSVPHAVAVPAVLLVLGFLLELTPYTTTGRVLRALSASYVGIDAWKLYRRPKNAGRLVNWLWTSSWGLVAGLWLYALFPSMGIHGLHLMFISGFGLMTLMIATRVTLAHGGYDLDLEMKSRAIRWSGVLIVIAAITRVVAPFTPSYMNHLGYAATAWIVAMMIWMAIFVPRIVRRAV